MNRRAEPLSFRQSQRNAPKRGNGRPKTEKNVIENLLEEAQRITLAVFYIGCGATVFVWEAVEQWSEKLYSGVRPLWLRKSDEKPTSLQKKKVTLFPIDHYNRLDAGEIIERVNRLSKNELDLVRAYEKAHLNRHGVLEAIDRRRAE